MNNRDDKLMTFGENYKDLPDGYGDKNEPKEDKSKDNPIDKTKNNSDSANKTSLSKDLGKKALNNTLEEKSSDDYMAREMKKDIKKTRNAVKKTKKAIGAITKMIKGLMALGPLGWLILLLMLFTLLSLGETMAKDGKFDQLKENGQVAPNAVEGLKPGENTSDVLSGGDNAVGGVSSNNKKIVTLLIDCKPSKKSNKNSSSTSSDGASDQDWTKEGTTAYNNAKAAFDLWTSKGLSGEAAAGIIGWTVSEGGWGIVGRAEGHFSNVIEEASIKYGNVPIPSGNYPVGGGGIYQFTPYTKYAELSSPDWEDSAKMNEYVAKQMPNDWIPSHDMTGGNHSFEDFAKSTNAEEATLMWNAYERGNQAVIPKAKKQADAKTANEIFNKDKIAFDADAFNKNFGSGKGSGDGAKKSSAKVTKKTKCRTPESSGGTGWRAHKTGSVNYNDGTPWTREDLPADLKPYALDPESVGLKWGDTSSWELLCYSYGQCTDFVANMMYHLWEKDGSGPRSTAGNGYQVVDNWVAKFGGSSSNEPKAGSVFSTAIGEQHTGVVSHVFENGDILVVEQNVQGYSGDQIGQQRSWSYRYITVSHYSTWKFYDPEEVGYKIKNSAKALA